MSNAIGPAPARSNARRNRSVVDAGLPDPRPVTEYTVAVTTPGGNTRLTITLSQPCAVRAPLWRVVNCDTGAFTACPAPVVTSNTSFYYQFPGVLDPAVGFVDVPYMDTQVQNFQGGFVRPGGQWFRAPLAP
jgi:hypothetical protein